MTQPIEESLLSLLRMGAPVELSIEQMGGHKVLTLRCGDWMHATSDWLDPGAHAKLAAMLARAAKHVALHGHRLAPGERPSATLTA